MKRQRTRLSEILNLNPAVRTVGAGVVVFFLILTGAVAKDTLLVRGSVVDSISGARLSGAILGLDDGQRGTIANQEGEFLLRLPPGSYTLTVRSLGYRPLRRVLTLLNDTSLTLRLQAESMRVDEVLVTAEKDRQANVESVEISVATVDMANIKKVPVVLGERDLIKTLQLQPGVSSVSEGSSGFNVRGGAADQNLALLDNATIYNPSHLFGFFSAFNTDALDDVKLYKGGIPAQYGGRLSSVLDIRQKSGNHDSVGLMAGIGLISSRALLEGPLPAGRGSFLLAGRRSYADLFLAFSDDPALRDNKAYFYDLNAKLNFDLSPDDRLSASAYFGRDNFEIDKVFGNSWGNAAATLRWNHVFSDNVYGSLSGIYSQFDYDFKIFEPSTSFEWRSGIQNREIKADIFVLAGDHTLSFGIHALAMDFNPAEIEPIGNSSTNARQLDEKRAFEPAVYISNEQSLGDDLTLRYGLRYSYFQRSGAETVYHYAGGQPLWYNSDLGRYEESAVVDSTVYGSGDRVKSYHGAEPRISLRYSLNEVSSLKASYNRTRQYIHQISNTTSPTPLDVWMPSGPYIEPQIADQLALGYFRNIGDEYELSLETYYKLMQNQIGYVDGADLTFNETLETELLNGEGRAYGLELLFRKSSGRLTGWLSYTLARSERRNPGLSASDPGINDGRYYVTDYDKTHDLSLTAMYELDDNWSISANFIYASGRPITYPEGRYEVGGVIVPQYGERNAERIPDYHRLDLSLRLQGAQSENFESEWIFGLYNVYNRLNAASIYFRQNEDEPTVTEAVKLAFFGIVPSITYSLYFK